MQVWLDLVLIVLVIAAIWAVVELALVFRRSRTTLGKVGEQVEQTLDEVRPIISKLDGLADELGPAAQQVEPLIEKVGTTVDALSLNLMQTDKILADVSNITSSATSATNAVSDAAHNAGKAVKNAVSKITGKKEAEGGFAKLSEASVSQDDDTQDKHVQDKPHTQKQTSYFTYPEGHTQSSSDDTEK